MPVSMFSTKGLLATTIRSLGQLKLDRIWVCIRNTFADIEYCYHIAIKFRATVSVPSSLTMLFNCYCHETVNSSRQHMGSHVLQNALTVKGWTKQG